MTLKDKSSLSKTDRDTNIESQLLNLFKFLYPEVFKEDIKNFEDIKLKDLIPIWQIYFVSRIKTQTIDAGRFQEVLPFIFDIFKDNKALTISQFIEQTKALLQNFYYIDLGYKEEKEQLKKIKEESEKDENKDKPFIVYTCFSKHAVVSIIQDGQISIIDSSRIIFDSNHSQDQQILIDCGFKIDDKEEDLYFNTISYQQNGTCYLDATLAFKSIMEKLYLQQQDKKPEDISPATLNSILHSILNDLKNGTNIELTQSGKTIKLQRIVVNVVNQLAKFYETLQQPIPERYIADVKVLEKDASATTLTTTTTTTTTEPETEFTDIGGTTPPSSKTSEEAANNRKKEDLQEELRLGTITKNELAIIPKIIAETIYKDVSSADTTSKIFGAIPEVKEWVDDLAKISEMSDEISKMSDEILKLEKKMEAIQEALQKVTESQTTSQGLAA